MSNSIDFARLPGRRFMVLRLHLSSRGEAFVEFIDGFGLGRDATIRPKVLLTLHKMVAPP